MLVTRLAFLFVALFLPSIAILPDVMAAPPQSQGAGQVHEIQMTAKKYEFSPDPIRVKNGERVRLVITAIDHDHGFKLEAFNVEQKLKKGVPTTVEFTADKAGTFPFKCSVHCGIGHGRMKGTLIVEE
jgi:cytochrome c oxidase subunit II